MAGWHAVRRQVDGRTRHDRKPARLWVKRWGLSAREIEADTVASLGEATVLWRQSIEVSTRNRSMTLAYAGGSAGKRSRWFSWLTTFDSGKSGFQSIRRLASRAACATDYRGGVHKNIGFADPAAPPRARPPTKFFREIPSRRVSGSGICGLPDVRTWHDRNYSSSAPLY